MNGEMEEKRKKFREKFFTVAQKTCDANRLLNKEIRKDRELWNEG